MKGNHRHETDGLWQQRSSSFQGSCDALAGSLCPIPLPPKALNILSANAENESLILLLYGNLSKQMGIVSVFSFLKVSVGHGFILYLITSNLTQE